MDRWDESSQLNPGKGMRLCEVSDVVTEIAMPMKSLQLLPGNRISLSMMKQPAHHKASCQHDPLHSVLGTGTATECYSISHSPVDQAGYRDKGLVIHAQAT
jgi:hypothetical protein